MTVAAEERVTKDVSDQIENIAAVCHAANRMYCLTLGDLSQPEWMQAPDWQNLRLQ